MVKEIDSEELKKIIIDNRKVLVDCYADWCGPCKMLGPIIEQLSKKVEDTKFYKINVDNDEDISLDYGISAIPNLLYFEDGKLKIQIIGLKSKDDILDIISK